MMSWPRISPNETALAMRSNHSAYLDVRTVEEFELGHPEGAYNVPWLLKQGESTPNPDFVSVVAQHFARERSLIVGCRSGKRSTAASAALQAAGFQHVSEQRAGYAGSRDAFGGVVEAGWESSGLPTQLRAAAGRSYQELLAGRVSDS